MWSFSAPDGPILHICWHVDKTRYVADNLPRPWINEAADEDVKPAAVAKDDEVGETTQPKQQQKLSLECRQHTSTLHRDLGDMPGDLADTKIEAHV